MGALEDVTLLKRDVFGRVELVQRDGVALVRRVACGGALPGSRAVARLLLARERRALAALRGLPGVPQLTERHPDPDVLERSYLAGAPLHRCQRLPLDFFERLAELVRALHAAGVAHNDLHKEQNVVVGADGWPALIDFQLASLHDPDSRALQARAHDDLRHVAKHRRRYLRYARVGDAACAPDAALRADPPRAPGRSTSALVWRRTVKPVYHFVTRRLLHRRDGEERRETRGAWPVWVRATGPRALP